MSTKPVDSQRKVELLRFRKSCSEWTEHFLKNETQGVLPSFHHGNCLEERVANFGRSVSVDACRAFYHEFFVCGAAMSPDIVQRVIAQVEVMEAELTQLATARLPRREQRRRIPVAAAYLAFVLFPSLAYSWPAEKRSCCITRLTNLFVKACCQQKCSFRNSRGRFRLNGRLYLAVFWSASYHSVASSRRGR